MPDDNGTEPTRSDAPSADESLFGEAAEDTEAAVADEQDANEETAQEPEGVDDGEGRAVGDETGSSEDQEGRRVHQGRQGHHRGATALVGPIHRVLR